MSIVSSNLLDTYAKALLELACSKSMLEEVVKDMNLIEKYVINSTDFQRFLENPLIDTSAKKNVIKELFSDNVSSITLSFLLVLVDRGRTTVLSLISQKFLELSCKERGIVIAKIASAVVLSTEQQKAIAEKIKTIVDPPAEHVKLALKVDPSLYGGFTIEIGSNFIDASIRGQLKQIAILLDYDS